MITKTQVSIFLAVCTLYVQTLLPYIMHINYLYNRDIDQHVFLISDMHLSHKASAAQRSALLKQAKKLNAFLVIEDQMFMYSDIDPDGVVDCDKCLQPLIDTFLNDPVHFDPNAIVCPDTTDLDAKRLGGITPLLFLTHFAHDTGLKAVTVECRQTEMASTVGWPISASTVMKAIKHLVQETLQFNDGPILKSFYKTRIDLYKKHRKQCKEFFDYLKTEDQGLAEIYEHKPHYAQVKQTIISMVNDNFFEQCMAQGMSDKDARKKATRQAIQSVENGESVYDQLMCDMFLFLIDTRILHHVAHNTDEQVIFIIAGAAHINAVKPILQSLGYEEIDDYGSSLQRPNAMNLNTYFDSLDITPRPTSQWPIDFLAYKNFNLLLALLEPYGSNIPLFYSHLLDQTTNSHYCLT